MSQTSNRGGGSATNLTNHRLYRPKFNWLYTRPRRVITFCQGPGFPSHWENVIRNIIFDWSGTLVDDLPAVWEATNFVFSQAGLPVLTLEQFRAEFCLPFTDFYARHTPKVSMEQLEGWFHG